MTLITSIKLLLTILLTWHFGTTSNYFGVFWEYLSFGISLPLQTFSYFIAVNAYIIIDSTYIIVLGYIYQTKNALKIVEWQDLKERIKTAVLYQNAIYDVSEKINETFRNIYLVQFLSISVELCMLMYDLSLKKSTENMLLEIMYIPVVMLMTFIICYWGNEIKMKSVEVENSCCDIDFLGTDIRF
ncbi:hypothetical protein FQR65_LT06320 [Abscondita terminalis]|nr:hypothetical protein FQR65_LT06320 [Abscondita terminalis]